MGLYAQTAPVDVIIAVWPWGAYLGEEGKRHGVRAKVSSWRRISPAGLIPHAKASGQYLNSILAKTDAAQSGFDEAILLDEGGLVCEGSGENVFLVREGQLVTPGHTASILDGISRKSVIQIGADLGYEVVERDVARAELYLAEEIFLCGTAAELVPGARGRRARARRPGRGDEADPGQVRGRPARARPRVRGMAGPGRSTE